jgi:putative transposase
VKVIRRTHPCYGLRKLHHTIQRQGITIGRDRLREQLRVHGLLFKPHPGRFFVKTTDSNHRFKLYPNLLRDAVITHPEQYWVADVTFISIQGQFYYLALVCDAYSRRIMGWAMHDKNTGELVCKALVMANSNRHYINNIITHHSDRGTQYCGGLYRMLLHKLNMKVSTTESGDPRENAIMERTIRTLKYEYGLKNNLESLPKALERIEYAVNVYNHLRIHYSCGLNTPAIQHIIVKKPPLF